MNDDFKLNWRRYSAGRPSFRYFAANILLFIAERVGGENWFAKEVI